MRGMTRAFRSEGQEELTESRLLLAGIMNEEIERFKASPEGKGFWGCRKIWDCLRSFETEAIVTGLSPANTLESRLTQHRRHENMP